MKWRIIGCAVLAGTFMATSAQADGGTLFRGKCGSCHKKGGSAAVVNPADKAAVVWQKFFKRGRHKTDMGVADADLQSIIEYLQAYAADSDRPETAAIPK